MENSKKIRDLYKLYELYIELGHDAFVEIMGVCLHNSIGNAISMNSLNTIIPNAMENCKLGDASFDDYDLFSLPSCEEEICFDDTMAPIYDDYNDECDLFSPPTIEHKVYYDYDMPSIYDDYNDDYECFTPTITNEKDFTYVESNNNTFMHVNHDKNALYDTYVVRSVCS